MSDYVKFSELNKPLQMAVIDAYSAMLFDFDNPPWFKEVQFYSQVANFANHVGNVNRSLQVKYKQEKDTTLGKRPVVMRVPEVSFKPSSSDIFYLSNAIVSTRMAQEVSTPPLGIINQRNTLFYATLDTEIYLNDLREATNQFCETYSKHKLLPQLTEMTKELTVEENPYGDTKDTVTLFIEDGLLDMYALLRENTNKSYTNDNLVADFGNHFLFSLVKPIHSYTSGATYMRGFRKSINVLYDKFRKHDITEYLIEEKNGTSGRCLFYVINGGEYKDLPLHPNMLFSTSAIPLRPFINRAVNSDVGADGELIFDSLARIEETLIDGIELFVDSVSTMLNIYQDALRQEINRRLRPSYFSKWADEKGLTFQKISGEMRTPSKNP